MVAGNSPVDGHISWIFTDSFGKSAEKMFFKKCFNPNVRSSEVLASTNAGDKPWFLRSSCLWATLATKSQYYPVILGVPAAFETSPDCHLGVNRIANATPKIDIVGEASP